MSKEVHCSCISPIQHLLEHGTLVFAVSSDRQVCSVAYITKWWSNFYPKSHRRGAIESILWKTVNTIISCNYIKKFTWLLQQSLSLTDRSMRAYNEHRFSKLRQLNCILNDSISYCRSSRQLPRLIDVDLALRACNSSRRIHVSVGGVFSDYITRRLTSLKRVKNLFRIKTNYFHFNWHLICTDILKKNDI